MVIADGEETLLLNGKRRRKRAGCIEAVDDILDLTSDAETMGKATGKDAARGKATLVALHGMEWAETRLRQHVNDAEDLLAPYGKRSEVLVDAARFVADRKS